MTKSCTWTRIAPYLFLPKVFGAARETAFSIPIAKACLCSTWMMAEFHDWIETRSTVVSFTRHQLDLAMFGPGLKEIKEIQMGLCRFSFIFIFSFRSISDYNFDIHHKMLFCFLLHLIFHWTISFASIWILEN